MGWKISDILALLVTLFVSLNILISVISLSGKHLERRMDMGHLSLFLKMVLVFSAFGMPVLAGVILYKFVFGERIYLVSDDLLYMDTIHKGSISYGTPWGNHWISLLLFLAWFLGFIYYGIFKYANDRRILKKLEKCSKYTQDKLLIETKREAMNELGLKGPVLLLSNEIIQSPFMTGIFEQKIFLPESNYTQEEWGLLLKHELVHCKNQDYFFRRLVFILCALHWFNPLIYRLSDYFVEVNEMACDEKVLNRQPIKRHTMYAELILQIQEKELGLTTVSLTGHTVNGLERRIRNMRLKEMMDEICSRWSLPKDYIEFLFNHENNLSVNVDDDDEDLSYEIEIYGAKGLLVGQYGYSYNPVQKAVIEDWNPNYVVIANCNADPYCIDISIDNSPVYYAVHGEGEWEFEKDSESLEEFFEFLGIR